MEMDAQGPGFEYALGVAWDNFIIKGCSIPSKPKEIRNENPHSEIAIRYRIVISVANKKINEFWLFYKYFFLIIHFLPLPHLVCLQCRTLTLWPKT